MSSGAQAAVVSARSRWQVRSALGRLSVPAWGAVGVTLGFIALTCWWLTQDRSIPIYDAGYHLHTVIDYYSMLQSGDLLGPFNNVLQYPPLAFLVGAFGMLVGGRSVASPIVAENVVFVPLLTLGCYQTGRLLFGARAGLLAAIFVLGSPLLIGELHAFLLDAPLAALVAVAMWLILASDDFSRVRFAGFAGLAVGCGLLIKVTFPLFLAGIVLTALASGAWRNWRGLAVFAAVALVVGAPWYVDHLSEFSTFVELAGAESGAVPGNLPPTLSTANLLWYFWSTLNSQLLAPLFLLAIGGTIWTILDVVRGGEHRGLRLELLVGLLLAWLAVTLTPHKDIRYDMPLVPYLAVLGTGWIVYLPRAARLAGIGVLVLAVGANTLGATFGVGGPVQVNLTHRLPATEALPDRIVLYSNEGGLGVAGPQRDGDIPGLLRALHASGVRIVTWSPRESRKPDFSSEGLFPLALIAGLQGARESGLVGLSPRVAELVHVAVRPGAPPPCTRLSDGTGVWVLRLNPAVGRVELYCPFRRQPFNRA